MILSIFTTISDFNNNHWKESLASYADLADEVVVIDGNRNGENMIQNNPISANIKWLYYEWPEEFDFSFIGQQFQRGGIS